MKTLYIILALFLFGAASASSQTLKTLSYNTTNGQVVYSGTNPLTFTNPLAFGNTTNAASIRTNLGLGTTSTVNFGSLQLQGSGSLAIGGMGLEAPDSGLDLAFKRTGTTNMVLKTNGLVLHVGSYSFSSGNTTGAAITRTNLGLGATWLTNSASPLFWTSVPASTTNSGTSGQVAYTNNYLYICISNNTWRRVQLGTW
jgi:hypothetical protein